MIWIKRRLLRAAFRVINRFIVVPGFRMGLGRIISNPLAGNIMVLRMRGRKTGKLRYVPVSYALREKTVYCYQGKETRGQWYLNLLADPEVYVLLPEGRFTGQAEEISGGPERLEAIRLLLQSSGLSRSMYGFDPAKASDEEVAERTRGIPVIRITLDGSFHR